MLQILVVGSFQQNSLIRAVKCNAVFLQAGSMLGCIAAQQHIQEATNMNGK